MVVDVLARRVNGSFKNHKAGAEIVESRYADARVVLAKPRSYMNLSGAATAALARFFSIEPDHIIAVHDELDLPPATIRVKSGGGEGGHNGLRSISAAIGTKDYLRVRFGIGRPPGRMDAADFVLRDFSAAERKDLDVDLEHAADAVELLIEYGLEATQNRLHGP
jgi:PTH1 family peptidyl-tRNA hydrolase